ncbi:MAG TPA: DNA-formamidopyrimidine glycosylase family protein [Mycobacteriales bacterium]|nr:DNA-formamidopyrimidine glycosylase family protein [Mycobacteriales bacterium]
MPEGDTVWLSAKRMHGALAGKILTSSDFRVPRYATRDLSGQRVVEVVPRGKHMLTRLDSGLTLHTHFEMEGTWRIFPTGQKWAGGPAHEIRIVLRTDERSAVGYRIPVIDLLETKDEAAFVGHLGPDLLSEEFDAAEAKRRLLTAPGEAVAEALLDQRNLAGIGNLYKAEVLFLTGTDPWTPVGDVAGIDKVIDLSRRLLMANRDRDEQITTGNRRRGEQTWVYGRAGKPCRRCGTPIRKADQGRPGNERVTFWCAGCQTGPAEIPAAIRPA